VPTRSNVGASWVELVELPQPFRTKGFALEPLSGEHTALDHAALMSCRARLRRELDWGGWPPEEYTLEENRADLARHHAELVRREAFAYTVLSADGARCLGCVYLEACEEIDGAQLAFWVIDDAFDLESELVSHALRWVHAEWGIARVVVPLRESNPRGIAVAEGLGLTPFVARRDALLKGHRCFVSSAEA
jgi:RimJ/RimL family protein N-acetyltransferase